MRKIILALLFLVCCAQNVTTQPRNRNPQPQTQQPRSQPSPTPVDSRQAEIDNAAKAERERYEKERDSKEDAFKAAQLRQNDIIVKATLWMAVFAGFNSLVAGVYAFFAYRTLKAVDKQANYASEQVGVTKNQLTAMDRERRVLHTHAGAMLYQARIAKELLNETRSLVGQNADVIATAQGQLGAMKDALEIERAKTNARLRVSKIRIENFEVGTSPIFITTIANDGYIDAVGVEIHIGIRLGDGRAFKWIDPQTVTIPARGEESYPLVTGASLSEQDMEGFKAKKFPIEVVVGIRFWNGSPNEPKDFCYRYCYRYLPWPAQRRPDDVRQFFPGDFDPRMNISLRISGVVAVVSPNVANVVIEKAPPKDTKPEEETNGKNEDKSEGEQGNPN